jgi:hypothetical protein
MAHSKTVVQWYSDHCTQWHSSHALWATKYPTLCRVVGQWDSFDATCKVCYTQYELRTN